MTDPTDERIRALEADNARLLRERETWLDSDRRLGYYADTMTDVVWTSDLYFRWNFMSPSIVHLLGYTPEECLALTPDRTLTPASLKEAMANLAAGHAIMFKDPTLVRWPTDMEIEQIRKDGSTVWTEVRVTIMRRPDGTPYGFLGITRDISKRKAMEDELRAIKAELEARVEERTRELTLANTRLREEIRLREAAVEALRRSEEHFRTLNENASDIVGIANRDGVIRYTSPAYERLLGYSEAESRNQVFLDLIHPDDRPAMREAIGRLFAGPDDEAQRLEYRYRHKDGSWLTLESVGRKMPDWRATGEFVFNTRDLTDKKRLEEERSRSQKLESIGLLAGGLAHDFNNILTIVLGNVSLVRRTALGDPVAAARLERAESACARAKELTTQLLTFARGGAPVRRAAAIRDVLYESAEFTLAGSNVRIRFDLPADLPPVIVDAGQISRVIQNLVLNAREAMPEGGEVRVAAEAVEIGAGESALKPGPHLLVSVSDSGPGIPSEHRSSVFDPYFTTKPGGSGLGLAVAFSIVHRHEGRILVDDAPGGGARFRFWLPVAPGAPEAPAPRPASVRGGGGRVLVMDDEPAIVEVLHDMLAQLGYAVQAVPDGAAAIAAHRSAAESGRPFDAVILDLTVRGGLGGEAAARAIRALDPRVPLIVASGYANDPALADYRTLGFDDHIAKPFRFDQIDETLHRAIDPARRP